MGIIRKIIVSILIIVAFGLLFYNIAKPSHLNANMEVQYCGGCHTEESTIHMHEYVNPTEKECIECHTEAALGLSVHAEMIPTECDRCHEMGDKVAYSDCDLCHSGHLHIEGGIKTGGQPCISCHQNHTILTDMGCSKCHSEEYDTLKTMGNKHSELPDSCYTCHIEHKSIPACLDCHEEHVEDISHNCAECHQPHSPKELNFSISITSEDCGKCHSDTVEQFKARPSKHSSIQCVDCHQQHEDVKECSGCHEEAHPAFTELTTDKCLACHRDAHSPDKY